MNEPIYTVFIRVPIPRGDFVDPPAVTWDSSKDDALWKILSGATQTEIDWNKVADRFDVPVDFLLKQVAFLTDRHASQVRAQVLKATAAVRGGSGAPSPVPGSDSAAALRPLRKDSTALRNDGSGPGTPIQTLIRPQISRNASNNTAVLRDGASSSPRPTSRPTVNTQTAQHRLSSLPITSATSKTPTPPAEPERERSPSPGPAELSSTTSSEDESSPAQSRIIRRPPRFQHKDTSPTAFADDEDDESEPVFQPYRPPSDDPLSGHQDLNSTLRGNGRTLVSRKSKQHHSHHSQTSDSDTSSTAMVRHPRPSGERKTPGPLSPRRTAELAGKSPSGKASREGSEGTPSMGSSFSDLDDASVTQSALEEVIASQMNGTGSRFSISQAFPFRGASRYTPGGKQ